MEKNYEERVRLIGTRGFQKEESMWKMNDLAVR